MLSSENKTTGIQPNDNSLAHADVYWLDLSSRFLQLAIPSLQYLTR